MLNRYVCAGIALLALGGTALAQPMVGPNQGPRIVKGRIANVSKTEGGGDITVGDRKPEAILFDNDTKVFELVNGKQTPKTIQDLEAAIAATVPPKPGVPRSVSGTVKFKVPYNGHVDVVTYVRTDSAPTGPAQGAAATSKKAGKKRTKP
jgi:hypothetical protein